MKNLTNKSLLIGLVCAIILNTTIQPIKASQDLANKILSNKNEIPLLLINIYARLATIYLGSLGQSKETAENRSLLTRYAGTIYIYSFLNKCLLMNYHSSYSTTLIDIIQFASLNGLLYRGLTLPKEDMAKKSIITKYAPAIFTLCDIPTLIYKKEKSYLLLATRIFLTAASLYNNNDTIKETIDNTIKKISNYIKQNHKASATQTLTTTTT